MKLQQFDFLKYYLLFSASLLLFYSNIAFSQESVNGLTPGVIIFGQSAAFKGASSALGSELWRGSQAYFDEVNSKGGVHGRLIKVVSIDDGYEGNKTLVNTIRLITEHKVFGLYGYVGTPTIVKALPAIQKFSSQGVFLFSNFTGAQPQREPPHSKYTFNIRSSYRQETAGIVDNLVKIGYSKFGVFIQYDAYGRSGADGVARALKKFGLKILAETTYKRGTKYQFDMNPQVKAIQSAGIEAVISIGSYAACAAFIRDARLAGFKGPIANVSFVGADSLLNLLKESETKKKKVLTNNLINTQVVPPWDDTSFPLVREYQKLMNKHKNKIPENLKDPHYKPSKFSFVSLEGFLNAKTLVEILKRSPKKITRKKFVETAESLNNYDVGLGVPLSFSKNKHQASDTVFYTTIKDGKYITIKNWNNFKP